MTRRELLALLGTAAPTLSLAAERAPVAPVAVARCQTYDDGLAGIFATMFDQLGGLERIVKGKTVSIKLNLTGSPALKVMGKPLGLTHYTHPKTLEVLLHLMNRAGAKRIRLMESCWATGGPLEEYLLDSGWSVRRLAGIASNLQYENTNALGRSKQYARMKVPGGGAIFPAYDLNAAYEQTDVFVSLAKLKEHETCGVTLAMKNCFGITPSSIYGDDAGEQGPNESPGKGRVDVMHLGKRGPSKSAPQEVDPHSSRDPGYRVPRVTVDLVAARPIDLSIIDGIETIAGGEGPWNRGIRPVKPGLLIAGTNPVCTDAVATALMGFDPRARKGVAPFTNCDNTLLLAEERGIGSADLRRIEVTGTPLDKAIYSFQAR
jgi:uncharacterized protein (DUF362 family)